MTPYQLEVASVAAVQQYFMQRLERDEPYLSDDGPTDSDDAVDDLDFELSIDDGDPSSSAGVRRK